ncbi:MAG: hypothetical protein EXR69_07105 [Myxococcales bacterium]|nr:hypothetical protein [Myxococcales bacterium]
MARSKGDRILLGVAGCSVLFLAFGAWQWRAGRADVNADWRTLAEALVKVRADGDSAVCEGVAVGAPQLNCLLVAADRALHVNDLAALTATCGRMPDPVWKESCLLDAIAIDPTLSLVTYVDRCEAMTPTLAFHCESHARNRMKLFPREIPLAAEEHPEDMVRVFPKLVYQHTVPENEETAAAFGARLSEFGRPATDCLKIEVSLQAACTLGF